jgi:hypothetical protein
MKFRFVALFLALAVVAWTQTSTPNQQILTEKPGVTAAADNKEASCHSDGKDGASCCAKMKAESKDGMSCCAHHEAADGKDAMACCHHDAAKDGEHAMSCCAGGMVAKSGMNTDKSAKADSATAGCCPNGDSSGKVNACCNSAKETKTTAMACCSGGHCEMSGHSGMPHGDMSK